MATKKVKITVTQKKVNIKKILVLLIIIIGLGFFAAYIIKKPITNIYISGNKIISDKRIIELAKLNDYPQAIKYYFYNPKNNILKDEYIKDVKITQKQLSKIYIEVKEYKPIAIYNDELILSSKKKVANKYNIDYVPYVTNDIDGIYDKFVDSFAKIDDDILLKISHIEYAPNEVDKERFILYMVDSNYVHVTLSKITKINKYNSIVNELDNKKGIIYLDSGDYLEIKDWHYYAHII